MHGDGDPTEEIAGDIGHPITLDGVHLTYRLTAFDLYRTRHTRISSLDCRGCGPLGHVPIRVAGQREMRLVKFLFLLFVFLTAACVFLLLDMLVGLVPSLNHFGGMAFATGALSAMLARGLHLFIRAGGITPNDPDHVINVKSCRRVDSGSNWPV